MKIAIIGGAGFLGTNLAIKLSKESNEVKIIDRKEEYFVTLKSLNLSGLSYQVDAFDTATNFDKQVEGQEIVYHMASTIIPGTSNRVIADEIESNVIATIKLLDACVRQKVKRIVFISSGGTVYGKVGVCPIREDTATYPISSYGIQKITIEKLLYLYWYQKELDYRVIRLANPYGPYQRPDGRLGVITTFVYHAMKDGKIEVFGDGSIIRDFIYVDDAIRGIANIAQGDCGVRVFNLGSGKGTSVNEVINMIKRTIRKDLIVDYKSSRAADVPINYLDISRYEECYGKLNPIGLEEGVFKTARFFGTNM